jgi:hypothetical protein
MRETINIALNMQRRLWFHGHPDFRSTANFPMEVLPREHVIAYAALLGKTGKNWNIFSEAEVVFYTLILKIELACYILDNLDYLDLLDIEA